MDIVRVTSLDNHKLRLESVAVLQRSKLVGANRTAQQPSIPAPATYAVGPREDLQLFVFVGSTDGCITQFASTLALGEDGTAHTVTSSQTQKRSLECAGDVSFLYADAELRDPRLLALCGGRLMMLHPQTLDQLPVFVNVKGLEGASLCCVSHGTEQRRLAAVVKRSLVLLEYSESSCSPYVGADASPILLPEGIQQMAWQGNALVVGGKREYLIYDVRVNQVIDHLITDKLLLGPLLRFVDYMGGMIAVRLQNQVVLYDGKGLGTLDSATKVALSEDVVDVGFTHPFLIGIKGDGRVLVRSIIDGLEISHGQQFGLGGSVRALAAGPLTIFACTTLTLMCCVVAPPSATVAKFVRTAEYQRAVLHFEQCFTGPEEKLAAGLQRMHIQCGAHAFGQKRFAVALRHFSEADVPSTSILAAIPELNRPTAKLPADPSVPLVAVTTLESAPEAYGLVYEYVKRRRQADDFECRQPTDAERAVDYALFYMLVFEKVPFSEEELSSLFLPCSALVSDECMPLVVESGRNAARFSTLLLASTGKYREALAECQRLQLATEAVVPLQLSGDASLYVEHLPWIMACNPMAGVRSLTSGTDRQAVSHDAVLPLLLPYRGLPLKAYVAYLVGRRGNRDEPIHTLHALNMIEIVVVLSAFGATGNSTASSPSSAYAGGTSLRVCAGDEEGLLGETRRELLRFLQTSKLYDADVVLAKLVDGQLLEEQIAVYSREQDHAHSLCVYIYKMNDVAGAERYCLEHDELGGAALAGTSEGMISDDSFASVTSAHTFLGSGSFTSNGGGNAAGGADLAVSLPKALARDESAVVASSSSCFVPSRSRVVATAGGVGGEVTASNNSFGEQQDRATTSPGRAGGLQRFNALLSVMLRVLLVPPKGETPRMDDAIQLLDRQSTLISPLAVLETLPSDVCVAQIHQYLTRVFQAAAHRSTMLAVQAQAVRSVSKGFEKQRTLLTQRCVYVDDDRKCCVCKKKLGDAVIGVFPNLLVAHFRCFKDKELDPVRGVPFRAEL